MSYRARRALIRCSYIVIGAFTLWGADTASQILFGKIRTGVLTNLNRLPSYTCVQTVTRAQYQLPVAGSSCATATSSRELNGRRILLWHDRFRLDVGVGDNGEMFSWAGATSFENNTVSQLVSHGATGSGEFSSFLASVFSGDADEIDYMGLQDMPLGKMAVFNFRVPLGKSHYRYSTAGNKYLTVAYRGSFYADPDSSDLKQLDLEADEFPSKDVCRVADSMQYSREQVGQTSFMLPKTSSMEVIYSNATESLNETSFSGCREYVGESTISFDTDGSGESTEEKQRAALKPIPPKTHLKIRITPPIDSRKAAAGDAITGVIELPAKNKGETVVNAGDKLHGRILRLEQTMGPKPRWTVAILFETIDRGGVQEKISLKALDDGDRGTTGADRSGVAPADAPPVSRRGGFGGPRPAAGPSITSERPAGGGIYSFSEPGDLVLGQKFESQWETR